MKHNKFIINSIGVLSVAVAMSSCIDSPEKYYGSKDTAADSHTLMEYISSREEYSDFTALVMETGADSWLSGETLVTLIVPENSSMPENIRDMSESDRRMLVMNHIALTTIFSRNLDRLSLVRSLSGKSLPVEVKGGSYLLDGVQLSSMDHVCRNGILHTASEWLVPKKNLMEWISGLGDEYSIMRDSILFNTIRTFDKENSEVVGVDVNGRVVYDSVWVVHNPYINDVDLEDETVRYSFVIPSDESIGSFMEERNEWLEASGRTKLSSADSASMINWMLQASFLKGASSFPGASSIRSVKGMEIRTDYFGVKEINSLSNGNGILLDKAYVPKDKHYSRIIFNPYYIRIVVSNQAVKAAVYDGVVYDTYYPSVNITGKIGSESLNAAFLQFNSANADGYYYKFVATESSDSTATAELSPIRIMPGRYNLRMRFVSNSGNLTDAYEIYTMENIEDDSTEELIASINGVSKNSYGKMDDFEADGLVKSGIVIEDMDRPFILKVRIPQSYPAGTQRRIIVGNCTLVPADNY